MNLNPGAQLHKISNAEIDAQIQASSQRLRSFMGKHTGQRCVIIGNGPSLNRMDLSFLKDEVTFGLNRIYLGFERLKINPTYYVAVDWLLLKESHAEILANVKCPIFITQHAHAYFPDRNDIYFMHSIDAPFFSRDITQGFWEGFTVTYAALELAYSMGFSEVFLIGVDHNFSSQLSPNTVVTMEGHDENHFASDYVKGGVKWFIPDLSRMEMAYRLAKFAFEKDGRRVIDTTLDGRLTIFPKVNYREVFFPLKKGKRPSITPAVDPNPPITLICPFQSRTEADQIITQIKRQTYPHISPVFVNTGVEDLRSAVEEGDPGKEAIYLQVENTASTPSILNMGLEAAPNDLIAYFHPGVEYHPDHLAVMALTLLRDPQCQLVYSVPPETDESKKQSNLTWEGIKMEDLLVAPLIPLDCVMHRKSTAEALGGFDLDLAEACDWDFILRLFQFYKAEFIRLQTVQGALPYLDRTSAERRQRNAIPNLYEKFDGFIPESKKPARQQFIEDYLNRHPLSSAEADALTKEVEGLMLQANQAVEQNDLPEAARLFGRAISLAGFNAWLYNTRGNIYIKMDALPQALDDFSHVLKSAPADIDALKGAATALFLQGDYDAARPYAQQALMLQSNNEELQQLLGIIVQKQSIAGKDQKKSTAKPVSSQMSQTSNCDLLNLQKNWETFASQDPMWAILTSEKKKGNRWEPGEFFATGIQEISQALAELDSMDIKYSHGTALDFGCGFGRLTQALAMQYHQVFGIDIAPSMIKGAKYHNRFGNRCQYILNQKDDLSFFPDNYFDMIYSMITLQHIPPQFTLHYLSEFARILAPKGLLLFQLPGRRRQEASLMNEHVTYDPKRPKMEMHGIPKEEVLDFLSSKGLTLVHISEDMALNRDWESFRYLITK